MAFERVNEDTTSYLTLRFFDASGAPATPAAVQYRVDCLTNGRQVRDWTPVAGSLADTIQIVLTPGDNAILSQANAGEQRAVQIIASYGAGEQFHGEHLYEIDNLREPIEPVIVRGDDYSDADNRSFKFTGGLGWPDLTGATVAWTASSSSVESTLDVPATVQIPTGPNKVIAAVLNAATTASLQAANYRYKLTATLVSGRTVTLISGKLSVVER